MNKSIKKIVIVGGGTAGWMAAAAFAKFLIPKNISIHLIESPSISTVGVGEATLPGIRDFNLALGIDELDLIKKTQATFKLGIEFSDWNTVGEQFFHPFSLYGQPMHGTDFYMLWLHLKKQGKVSDLSHFCLSSMLAKYHRFAQPRENPQTPLAEYHYAYQFDASLYADYLRDFSVALGVSLYKETVVNIKQSNEGDIECLYFESGALLEGDLFIDCTGMRGLLIEQTLKTGFDDWSHWLPVNCAVAVQSENIEEPAPFTKATALAAGWKWRIPLQHRTGNGYVYCNKFISDQQATEALLADLNGKPVSNPKVIKFTTGRRKKFWNKNCICLGLSSGFLEPLESTSISLIQTGIDKILRYFPESGINQTEVNTVNDLAKAEMEGIRDFILLHYVLSQRNDSDFWRHMNSLPIPSSLNIKIQAFKEHGELLQNKEESFKAASWISLYNGFGVLPQTQLLNLTPENNVQLEKQLQQMAQLINQGALAAPMHGEFISQHCASNSRSGAF